MTTPRELAEQAVEHFREGDRQTFLDFRQELIHTGFPVSEVDAMIHDAGLARDEWATVSLA